ncbi:orotidine-5'-phosphate decarboxylase [Candidatus Uhrbacteria bacterium]|nr:orotidine-5'-phosphate decarboxylase [Candidatus Uhrbacteria bacterium]
MTTENAGSRIIVAIDKRNLDDVLPLVAAVGSEVGGFKVRGSLLRMETTGKVVAAFRDLDADVFADVKLNDVPDSMAEDAGELFDSGVKTITVMAASGIDGMRAAVDAKKDGCRVLAVTVLTSLDDKMLGPHVYDGAVTAKVYQFALDALVAGVDGIVCSPLECGLLRKRRELAKLEIWTPGIRPEWAKPGGQERYTTPSQAFEAGASRLIIGGPITKPPKEIGAPAQAVASIKNEITNALLKREMGSKS